ncbi:hypothetical protein DFH08DRAFT_811287 [Mycena albidolilacea]|uniref:Uncharacterized protein n=1 Tax=Mycena albidolilacea TaxID=1033008 RepID=A0AAD6ZWN0_9AGAR|nr:hypothetical protein DFH08DRAFT_811287 [Mycena albidolilacea]
MTAVIRLSARPYVPVPYATSGRSYGKIAVITGSSRSIGAAIAKHFGEQGAKVVVEQLARILAKDPSSGPKASPSTPSPRAPSKPQGAIDAIVKAAPSGRLGEVGNIARVVGFLASPAAQWVNGQNVRVDWGICIGCFLSSNFFHAKRHSQFALVRSNFGDRSLTGARSHSTYRLLLSIQRTTDVIT